MSQTCTRPGKVSPLLLHLLFYGCENQCAVAYHEPYLHLIERLLSIMPHGSLDSFFFVNSGSEAVEAALKMVRGITRKQNIVMQGAYHRRTDGGD